MLKKIIIIILLFTLIFPSLAYPSSLSWTCPNCRQTFQFDPRDQGYMDSWIANHQSVCGGGGEVTEYRPRVRMSLPGYLFIGGIAGGMLGGIYGLAYAQPEMLSYAAAGAFLGAIFTGLLWVVSTPGTAAEDY